MESNNLENLKKKLYQKAEIPARLERETFRQEENPANPYWQKKSPPTGQKGWKKAIRAVLPFIKTVFLGV